MKEVKNMMSFEQWLNSELAVNADPDFYLDAYDAYVEEN